MVSKNFDESIFRKKLLFFFKSGALRLPDAGPEVLPQLLAIPQSDIMVAVLVVIVQRRQVIGLA